MYKVLTLIVFLISLCAHAWAANFSDPVDGIFKGSYGDNFTLQVPSEVSKSPVTSNQEGDLTFRFDSNTRYTNFNQVTDLKVGDPVRVQYTIGKENEMVATGVTKLVNESGTTVRTQPGRVTTTTTTNQ